MAECDKVCRYIDLPLQHASAGVLKRMRRPGNRATYDKLLARIRQRVPGVTLRTTLIVGFPGETDGDFAELDGFVADTGFDHVGVFTYSHEEGTRAFGLADDVAPAVKRRRRNALMARQKKIVARAQKARIGNDVSVLIDGPSAGARPGPAGPARRAGARHRSGGVSDGLRPGHLRVRAAHPCSRRRRARLRFGRGPDRVRSLTDARRYSRQVGGERLCRGGTNLPRVLYLWVAASSKVTRVGL